MFKTEIVADSLCPRGNRLTSFLITFPRFILAELNTHRMLTKNSASSRAIRLAKMLEAAINTPVIPIRWMKEHTGMQGTQYFEDETCEQAFLHVDRCFGYEQYQNMKATDYLDSIWLSARDSMVQHAKQLGELGVTKQICNRLLEPFMWHTVLISGTEWENFFALRADLPAEIHMQKLAHMMLETYNKSIPKRLNIGEWHLPFADKFLHSEGTDGSTISYVPNAAFPNEIMDLVKVCTAKAAQTSYTVVGEEGKPMDGNKLIALHDRLLQSGHMSPFEHCARVMTPTEHAANIRTIEHQDANNTTYEFSDDYETWDFSEEERGWSGNFKGFVQYRKLIPGENKSDNRVIKYK